MTGMEYYAILSDNNDDMSSSSPENFLFCYLLENFFSFNNLGKYIILGVPCFKVKKWNKKETKLNTK